MPRIETNGTELYYQRSGSGETVLLVPGYMFGAEHWQPQVDALDGYDVTTIDLRGQWHSAVPAQASSYEIWNQAEDVHGLIQSLGLAPVHYVGLSMGGFIGLRLALKHPQDLRSLTLVDTTSRGEDADKAERYAAMREVVRAGQIEAISSALPISFFNDAYLRDQPEQVQAWLDALLATDSAALADISEALDTRDDVTDRLGEVNLPTLVIHGTEDISIEVEKGRDLAERIRGARFEPIEGAGHQSNVDSPEAVSRLLRAFIDSVRAGAPA